MLIIETVLMELYRQAMQVRHETVRYLQFAELLRQVGQGRADWHGVGTVRV